MSLYLDSNLEDTANRKFSKMFPTENGPSENDKKWQVYSTDEWGRQSFNFFSVINLNPVSPWLFLSLLPRHIFKRSNSNQSKEILRRVTFYHHHHLRTASQEDHAVVGHRDHCLLTGLFLPFPDPPENCHHFGSYLV